MEEFKIREAREKDSSGIVKLIKELAAFEHGLNQVTITEADIIRDGFGKEPLFQCIVAAGGEDIHGMALYYFTYSTWNGKCLYLEDLIVSRKQRNDGIGSRLMREVIEIGHRENVARISWQVLNWNLDAIDFYKKFGASVDDDWLNGRLNSKQIQAICGYEGS